MDESKIELKVTPMNQAHRELGAKMVPFGGWEMPVQYEGILAEHKAVREAAGLFDVSHMGRFEISGEEAVSFLNHVTINDVSALENYQSHYNAACYDHGGLVDDFLIYKCPDKLLMVPNAGNREKDMAWFRKHLSSFDAKISDLSEETALLALQGPKALEILSRLTDVPLGDLGYQRFTELRVDGITCRVFRTGYTGEDGFELWIPTNAAEQIWRALLQVGKVSGLQPIGLGARDTLRLEAGLCLYGHEIDETINPLEARLGWITKLEKPSFIGREALVAQKSAGLTRRLAGLRLLTRGIPRQGYRILKDGEPVGEIVSGTMSPTLGFGIGTGFVPMALSKPGTQLEVEIRGKGLPAKVTKLPFYRRGSRK
jgi:aminomethyltransferase